jgi:hypothetical protein
MTPIKPPLTEQQWARINGSQAGRSGYPSRYNPYFNDAELHLIWERARSAKFALHHV